MSPYIYVFVTVFSTVASQVMFKFGVRGLSFDHSLQALFGLINLYVFGGLFFSIVSIVSWMVVLTKLQLGQAYPFMSLTFPLVVLFSLLFFGEPINLGRLFGVGMIVMGLIFISKF